MGVCKERAWEALQRFSFERVAGTEAEVKAANMLKEECEKIGVKCEIESYELETPTVTKAVLAITKPEYKEIPCIGVAGSGNTPDEGLVGSFKYIENGLDANLIDCDGKIVLTTARVRDMKKIVDSGAKALIQVHGSFYDEESLVSELRPRSARGDNNIPSVVIHVKHAQELVLAKPEEIKLIQQGDAAAKSTSYNVIATIEGTDEKLKNEILMFSAHYDSVPYSPGAWDNMTGCINLLELMHYFNENKPRRTVKFLWCGAEELGGRGSAAYCEAHADELKNIIYDINFDMTGVTLGYEHFCCSASEETFNFTTMMAKMEGYAVDAKIDMYSSDSSEFALKDVPSCTFARLNCAGGKAFHNHYDNMDYMDADSFMITLNFVVKYAEKIANAPVNVIERKFAKSLEPSLNQWKERVKKMRKKDKKEEEKTGEKK